MVGEGKMIGGMEAWHYPHTLATLAIMVLGDLVWLILCIWLHSNIGINHHIIDKT